MRGARPILAGAFLFALAAAGSGLPGRAAESAGGGMKPLEIAKAMSEAYADLAEQIGPSVVGVHTERVPGQFRRGDVGREDGDEGEAPESAPNEGEGPDENGPLSPEDMIRRFFGDGSFPPMQNGPGPRRGRGFDFPVPRFEGLGSGVVLDQIGHILTNNHVVEGADVIRVLMRDETVVEADVVARDPETDIAVIKLKKVDVPLVPAKLGDSDAVRPGHIVLAVGSPFGQMHSLTSGIVSGKGRALGQVEFENYIQTDAAINPGNSGGPLVNLDGEVVGINTIIKTRSGGSEGVGFAVPVNIAKNVAAQLIERGRVVRGWLGILMRGLDDDMRRATGASGGAIVQEVYEDTPAFKGGLKRGDIIVEVNGKPIKNPRELMDSIAGLAPDAEAKIGFLRAEPGKTGLQKQEVAVKLTERDSAAVRLAREERENGGPRGAAPDGKRREVVQAPRLGLTLRETQEREREVFKEKGVMIAWADPQGPAAEKGLRRGMMLIEIDQKPVPDLAAARKALEGLEGKEYALILFQIPGAPPTYGAIKLKK